MNADRPVSTKVGSGAVGAIILYRGLNKIGFLNREAQCPNMITVALYYSVVLSVL